MTDIVQRLRKAYGPDHTNESIVETLPLEAADEIERLRRERDEARRDALEEAAEICREDGALGCRDAIKALKDRTP